MRGIFRLSLILLINILLLSNAYPADKVVDLFVDYKNVDFAGECREGLAINNQIPAPTLRFKEGDQVTLNVHNHMREGTTIHWHGLLVPWDMDGVENVSQEAIPPGEMFSYMFKLNQSGTYWYHSHAGFQEQQGLYGGFIVDPREPPLYTYTKDYVIVLSDWSNSAPDQIFANLKKDGDYYTPKFPLQPSLARFIGDYNKGSFEERTKLIADYEMMQDMLMSIYDIGDVAYDAYLLNGRPNKNPWKASVKVGDTVRLRFIGAGGSTIFHVKIPNASMKVVHIQGHDVEPYSVTDFTIAPGETTDVLVKIEKEEPYIIYAESADTLGAAYGALLTQPGQRVDYQGVKPFPTPQPVMMGHSMMDHGSMEMEGMAHHKMDPSESFLTKGSKYQNLKSPYKTNDPHKPFQEIKVKLSGYMNRFMWFINGLPEHEAEPILIEPGKRYRLIFTNTSMMHHPMHIHGHFFILRNGHGEFDPFLHTIEVPPGATIVADFDAQASGQWFFHCHHLYHMMAGMSRVFQYSTFLEDYKTTHPVVEPEFVKHPMGHPPHMHQASFLDLGVDPYHNVQKGNFNILAGWDTHKLQLYSEDAEINKGKVESADLDIFYWYLLNEFWSIKGGANYFYKPSHRPYWQPGIGIEGMFPYFVSTNLRTYLHEGSIKLDLQLSRDTQLAHNFFIRTGVRGVLATQAVKQDLIGRGVNYVEYIVRPYIVLRPGVSLFTEFDFTQNHGNLKKILQTKGESTHDTVLMVGVSLLF